MSEKNKKPRRLLKIVWRISLAAIMIAIAVKYIDFVSVWESITSISLEWGVLIFVLTTADRFLMSYKWLHLLHAAQVKASFWRVLNAYYQATFVQRLLPTALGGDALRAVLLTKSDGQGETVVASMVVEKLVGISAAILLGFLGLMWAGRPELAGFSTLYILLTLAAVVVGLLVMFKLSMSTSLVERLTTVLPAKIQGLLRTTHSQYLMFADRKKVIASNFVLAFVEQSTQILILLCCATAISVDASPGTIIVAIAVSQLLRKFAIVIEGWMFGELTNVLVCVAFGIDQAEALAFSLLGHAISTIACAPGGWFFLRSAGGFDRGRQASS